MVALFFNENENYIENEITLQSWYKNKKLILFKNLLQCKKNSDFFITFDNAFVTYSMICGFITNITKIASHKK